MCVVFTISLHAARRAMAAAPPLPKQQRWAFYTSIFFLATDRQNRSQQDPQPPLRKNKRKNKGKPHQRKVAPKEKKRKKRIRSRAGPARPPLPRSRCSPPPPPTSSPPGEPAKSSFPPACPSERSTQESLFGRRTSPAPTGLPALFSHTVCQSLSTWPSPGRPRPGTWRRGGTETALAGVAEPAPVRIDLVPSLEVRPE